MASSTRWGRAIATAGITVLWALAMFAALWAFLFSLLVLAAGTAAIPIVVGLWAFTGVCVLAIRLLSPFADKPASAQRTSAQDVAREAVPESGRQDE